MRHPKIPESDQMQMLHIRVPAKIKMDLVVATKLTGKSMNDIVNYAIRKYLTQVNGR